MDIRSITFQRCNVRILENKALLRGFIISYTDGDLPRFIHPSHFALSARLARHENNFGWHVHISVCEEQSHMYLGLYRGWPMIRQEPCTFSIPRSDETRNQSFIAFPLSRLTTISGLMHYTFFPIRTIFVTNHTSRVPDITLSVNKPEAHKPLVSKAHRVSHKFPLGSTKHHRFFGEIDILHTLSPPSPKRSRTADRIRNSTRLSHVFNPCISIDPTTEFASARFSGSSPTIGPTSFSAPLLKIKYAPYPHVWVPTILTSDRRRRIDIDIYISNKPKSARLTAHLNFSIIVSNSSPSFVRSLVRATRLHPLVRHLILPHSRYPHTVNARTQNGYNEGILASKGKSTYPQLHLSVQASTSTLDPPSFFGRF